jgi:anti-sigma regulatory factor (Ser/Thr protein kinase)
VEAPPGYGNSTHARVRMVARPASVPAARRFVDHALTDWGRESLIEDVALCVTELSTNATLHSGSHFFEVELHKVADAVRVAVLDTGQAPADSMAASSAFAGALLDDLNADDASTTGRGMFIVSALASSWGIDELPDGKRVWAEFTQNGTHGAQRPAIRHREPPPVAGLDADDWVVVRFESCPAALLIAHDENLSDTIRELQLIGADLQRPDFRKLAELLAGHVQRHAVNWDAARIQAFEAVRAGSELTDIHVLAPKNVMEDVRFLRNLVWEAEALSEAGKLITLPAPPEVQVLRDWLESEFRRQGEEGLEPVPFTSWPASST